MKNLFSDPIAQRIMSVSILCSVLLIFAIFMTSAKNPAPTPTPDVGVGLYTASLTMPADGTYMMSVITNSETGNSVAYVFKSGKWSKHSSFNYQP